MYTTIRGEVFFRWNQTIYLGKWFWLIINNNMSRYYNILLGKYTSGTKR